MRAIIQKAQRGKPDDAILISNNIWDVGSTAIISLNGVYKGVGFRYISRIILRLYIALLNENHENI